MLSSTSPLELVAEARYSVMVAHTYLIANKDNESQFYVDEMLDSYRAALLHIDIDDEKRRGEKFRQEIIEAGRRHGLEWFDVVSRASNLVSIIDTTNGNEEVPV